MNDVMVFPLARLSIAAAGELNSWIAKYQAKGIADSGSIGVID